MVKILGIKDEELVMHLLSMFPLIKSKKVDGLKMIKYLPSLNLCVV